MSDNIKHIISANQEYADKFGDKSELEAPPSRHLIVLTCMDARLEPLEFLGLQLGDAHIIRNAGGRASDDAIRSIVISSTYLGTNELLVIHHSGCGLETFTQAEMGEVLRKKLNTSDGEYINWLSITDRIESVKSDAIHIRNHPLVSKEIKITGYLFHTDTGILEEVISI